MPVKKRANKKIKKEIKRAAEQIPGLIFEHVRLQNQQETTSTKEPVATEEQQETKDAPHDYQSVQRKKKIMWAGVIGLTAIVFAMWVINTKLAFTDIKNDYAKPVPGITETAQKTWQETMKEPENKPASNVENLEKLKNQIKNNIISIFYAQQASTTASSTN
jgi:hypothetical protein